MQSMRSIFVLLMLIQNFIIVQAFAASPSKHPAVAQQSQYGDVLSNVIVIKFSEDYQIIENSINTENLSLNDRLKESGIYSLKRLFSQTPSALKKTVSSNLSTIYLASFQGVKTPW